MSVNLVQYLFDDAVLSILNPAPMPDAFNRDLLPLADVLCANQTEVSGVTEHHLGVSVVFSPHLGRDAVWFQRRNGRRCSTGVPQAAGIRQSNCDHHHG